MTIADINRALLTILMFAYPAIQTANASSLDVEASNSSESPVERPTTIEEIIVTAQFREQDLQRVPVAVTAIGREALQSNEINSVEDLSKLVPSFRVASGMNESLRSFRIRGVGTEVFSPSIEPNVSVVLDGVPLAINDQANFEFADLERVEVLRGPQGTLFGKNSTAGVIHVITRDPAPEFEATFRFNYEEPQDFPGHLFKSQFSVSGPLSNTVSARLSGYFKDVGGHYTDILQGDTGPDSEHKGGRIKLNWAPTDNLVASLNIEHSRSDGQTTPLAFSSANPDKIQRDQSNPPHVEYGRKNTQVKTFGNYPERSRNNAVSINIDWNFGPFTMTSITGWREFDYFRNMNIPNVDGDRVDVRESGGDRTIETFTQELRFTSVDLFKGFDLTLGTLWFSNSMYNETRQGADNVPASFAIQGTGLEGLLPDSPEPLQPFDSLTASTFASGDVDTDNLGIYAQANWNFAERWNVTAGLRYIYEKEVSSVIHLESVVHQATGTPLVDEETSIPRGVISDTHTIGMLSLQYDWRDSAMVYGTVSTGYRGGAMDLFASDVEDAFHNPVRPETALSFELGLKSRFLQDRLELNTAIFYTVFKDFQAQILDVATQDGVAIFNFVNTRIDNAGELETRGVELDLRARPTESILITGSFLYNDAVFNEFETQCFVGQRPGEAGGRDETGDGVCDIQDVAGGRLPNAPKLSASLIARYETPIALGNSRVYAQLTGHWQDDIQFMATQHPLAVQEAYSIWDLRIGWIGFHDRLEVAAYTRNIFDKFYAVNYFPLSLVNDRRDIAHFVPSDANRRFGISVAYTW